MITLEVKRTGSGDCYLDFSPAISLRSEVVYVEVNGNILRSEFFATTATTTDQREKMSAVHYVPVRAVANATDRHVTVRIHLTQAATTVRMHVKRDFDVGFSNKLPLLGNASEALRVLSETWNSSHTQLTLSLSGVAGKTYELSVWNPAQIASIKGGKLGEVRGDQAALAIEFPPQNPEAYVPNDVVLNFAGSK